MKKTVLFVALALLSSVFFTGCPGDPCYGENPLRVEGLEIKLPAPEDIQAGKTCRFEITGKLSGEKSIDFSSINRYALRVYVLDGEGGLKTCRITGASGLESPRGTNEPGYDYDIIKWYDNDMNLLREDECYFYTPHFTDGNLSEWIEVEFNEPETDCYIQVNLDFYSGDEYFDGYFYSEKFNVKAAETE